MSFKQSPTPSFISPKAAAKSSWLSPGFQNQAGICHGDTPEESRSSLHEILLTNFAAGDCEFQGLAVSPRMKSDRRHHFEGLFLSSGSIENGVDLQPLIEIARSLREIRFNGYIHQKAVLPKASDEWIAPRPAAPPFVNSSLQLSNRFAPLPIEGAVAPHP